MNESDRDEARARKVERGEGEAVIEQGPRLLALIVDDDDDFRTSVAALVRREGFETRVAGSLEEARKSMADASPDLVLVDLQLPDGNGLELLDDASPRFGHRVRRGHREREPSKPRSARCARGARLPSQAVRSRAAHRRARERRAHARPQARAQRAALAAPAARPLRKARRLLPADARGLQPDRAGRSDDRDRADGRARAAPERSSSRRRCTSSAGARTNRSSR